MSRRIICEPCGKRRGYGRAPEPAEEDGCWQKRIVPIRVKKPTDHGITINGVPQAQLATILCDDCGKAMPDGTIGVAYSFWRGEPNTLMAPWEHEFGEVLP